VQEKARLIRGQSWHLWEIGIPSGLGMCEVKIPVSLGFPKTVGQSWKALGLLLEPGYCWFLPGDRLATSC
jgi:hypothetical protein